MIGNFVRVLFVILFSMNLIDVAIAQKYVCEASNKEDTKLAIVNIKSQSDQSQTRSGTGFVIAVGYEPKKIYIITTAHTVEGDKKPIVTFRFQHEYQAKVLKIFESEDVAILSVKFEDNMKNYFSTLCILTSHEFRDGEEIFTYGEGTNYIKAYFSKKEGIEDVFNEEANAVMEGFSGSPIFLLNQQKLKVVGMIRKRKNPGFYTISTSTIEDTIKSVEKNILRFMKDPYYGGNTGDSKFNEKIEELVEQLSTKIGQFENDFSPKGIVIAQLLFEKTGEFIELEYTKKNGQSPKLEVILANEFKGRIQQMSEEGLKTRPDYIMRGLLELEKNDYRIYYSIVERETGKILAKADVSIPQSHLSLKQYQVYEGKDWGIKDETTIYNIKYAKEGSRPISPVFLNEDLELNDCDLLEGLIQDAITDYEIGKYYSALESFIRASQCPMEQKMVVHLGLAQCYKKLKQIKSEKADEMAKAYEIAKTRVGEIAIHQNQPFDVYFDSNSAKLDEDAKTILKSIGKSMINNEKCYQLVGHSDITGTEKSNLRLSQRRARSVKEYIAHHYYLGNRIKQVIGKGESECRICEEDNPQDRRVEFKVVDCG